MRRIPLPAPMEAQLVAELPAGEGWQFEPKWDGFRAIVGRRGGHVAINSKAGKPLERYFPELVEGLLAIDADDFILDGELVLPVAGSLSFDALQQRLHPAASRIARLARDTPAQLVLFDCLRVAGTDLLPSPLAERRRRLEQFHGERDAPGLLLSPVSRSARGALDWLDHSGGALDGIVAKRRDEPYRPGERAMLKIKQLRSADCVVGGFRRTADGKGVASLLLGLFDAAGALDHVGFCSAFKAADRAAMLRRLVADAGPPGFTGKAPGGPSRWRPDRENPWEPLRGNIVVEVAYDQVTARRFRHGTRFLRWRPDKAPAQCTLDQMVRELAPAQLAQLLPQGRASA